MTRAPRQHTRHAVRIAAELSIGMETLPAATQNLSEGGLGVVVDVPLAEGTLVDVAIFLTQDGIEDPDQEPFESRATVAWTARSETGACVAGLRFVGIGAAQRAQLRAFLAALPAG